MICNDHPLMVRLAKRITRQYLNGIMAQVLVIERIEILSITFYHQRFSSVRPSDHDETALMKTPTAVAITVTMKTPRNKSFFHRNLVLIRGGRVKLHHQHHQSFRRESKCSITIIKIEDVAVVVWYVQSVLEDNK